jgi:hypothetical protein
MPVSYVLVNVEPGSEEVVLREVRKVQQNGKEGQRLRSLFEQMKVPIGSVQRILVELKPLNHLAHGVRISPLTHRTKRARVISCYCSNLL